MVEPRGRLINTDPLVNPCNNSGKNWDPLFQHPVEHIYPYEVPARKCSLKYRCCTDLVMYFWPDFVGLKKRRVFLRGSHLCHICWLRTRSHTVPMLLNPLMMTWWAQSLFFRTLIEELHKGFVMLLSVVLHVQLIQFKDASIIKEGGAFFFLGDKVLPLPSLS